MSTSDPCNVTARWYGVVCGVNSNGYGSGSSFVKALYLNENNLTGSLPLELGNLESLETLVLHQNNLIGTIPPFIGSLSHLLEVHLSSNQLSGTIPNVSTNSNLVDLWLGNNQLSGTIPPSVIAAQLKTLQVNNNTLTGYLPSGVCDIGMFNVGGNKWFCPLPSCCGMSGKQICGDCIHGADVYCCWYLTYLGERQCLCEQGSECSVMSGNTMVGSFPSSDCDNCNSFCQ